jgi:hypothetical protein
MRVGSSQIYQLATPDCSIGAVAEAGGQTKAMRDTSKVVLEARSGMLNRLKSVA